MKTHGNRQCTIGRAVSCLLVILLLAVPAFGQDPAQNQSATPQKKENTWGLYDV